MNVDILLPFLWKLASWFILDCVNLTTNRQKSDFCLHRKQDSAACSTAGESTAGSTAGSDVGVDMGGVDMSGEAGGEASDSNQTEEEPRTELPKEVRRNRMRGPCRRRRREEEEER